MKKAIAFYVDDDTDIVSFTGTIFIKKTENAGKDYGADGAQCFNLTDKDIKDYYCPVKGKMEEVKNDETRETGK